MEKPLLIKDLSAPVTACKADWLPGTTWLGFTPVDGSQKARNQCQSTVRRQFGKGYIIEYVTEAFSKPNEGFSNDPEIESNRERHKALKGCFSAVHRLRATSRPLVEIVGEKEFADLQDRWAKKENRHRWSVAFPIIETFEILGTPRAKDVLGAESYGRLIRQSRTLLLVH